MSDFHPTRDEAVEALRAAIEDEGPRPDLHRKTMRKHRNEWPTLWKAIDALLAADAESPVPVDRKWEALRETFRATLNQFYSGESVLDVMDAIDGQ